MPVEQLAKSGLGISDELLRRLWRQQRIDGDGPRAEGDARNWVQLLDWIVQRSVLEQGLIDMRDCAAPQKGIAVEASSRDRRSTHRTAAATHILDDNRAQQRFHL